MMQDLRKVILKEVILVGGMTRMPKAQDEVKKFFGKEPSKGVNPDEVVAMGAAIQAGIMCGDSNVKDILLLDVTPMDVGIETNGGVMTCLIGANTTIPTKKSQIFSTADDNQHTVSIQVRQGGRKMACDNKLLGRFDLTDIPPAPRGVPQIDVTFDCDANGILHVSAKDMGTGKEHKIKIQSSGGLSDEEIQKMKKEMEEYAEEDDKRKEKAESTIKADSLIYSCNKTLKEFDGKINDDNKSEIEKAKEELTKLREDENSTVEQINSASAELESVIHKITSELYKDAGNPSEGSGDTSSAGGASDSTKDEKEEVVDSEYEEVKDSKDGDKK